MASFSISFESIIYKKRVIINIGYSSKVYGDDAFRRNTRSHTEHEG